MSFKLLIAACCLLAAVQARPPKPPTSTCSLACVSRTFWTGYQVGKVYTYQFDQQVEISTDLSTSQASRLRLSGLAKVEVHSDCEMALTVEVSAKDAKVGEVDNADALSPRDPPAKVLEALRVPLRFSYENGQVVQLCPSESETRASLNLKRGLLSQLQVSTEQRGQAHQLEERDILGDCWTEYTPEGPNTLVKTKDLSKCKINYQAYPLAGVKSFEDESIQSKQPITKGSLRCRIEIDAERDIVKETACTEEQIQSADHAQDDNEEKIRTTTKMTLHAEASGLVNALQEVSERTDLRHVHKTSSECHSSSAWLEEDLFHSGNECVERNHGAQTSAEFKAQAKKTLEELCEDTKKSQGMSRESPKKYADLIKYLRGITEQEHFNQLYAWVRDGYCKENPLLKAIFRSAIPTVGTKQSVVLILDQLSKSEVEGASRDNWLINGIALMQHPTPEILPELLTYVRKRREDAMLGVTRDEPLALSAVVHKICQELPNCEAEPKVKAVIDYFSDSLGPACEQFSTDADNAFVALLSVGNMGRVSGGAAALARCAASPSLPTFYRVFALHSLRRFAEFSPEAENQLSELLLNTGLDSELRIAAYQALSRRGFAKASRLVEAVNRLLNSPEDDRQVQMFVYTHAEGLQGEAANVMSPILKAASVAPELQKLSRRQYSSSLKADYYSEALGAGAQAEMPIVFSAQSAIPRYIGLNLTVSAPSLGQSINLMEIGLRMQGLERLIEDIYSRVANKFDQKAAKTPRTDKPEAAAPEQLTAEQRDLVKVTEPRVDLLVRRYGVQVSHTDLSGGMLSSIPEAAGKADYTAIVRMLSPAASPDSDPVGVSAGTLAESTLSIPTIAGLPILVKREMHYLTNLRFENKIRTTDSVAETVLDLKPAAAVRLSHTVAVDAIFERAGVQSSTSFLTSTGLRISVKKDFSSDNSQFAFKAEPLVKKQSVADVKTEVNFFQHGADKVHVEKPLVPQHSPVQREKCNDGYTKKYTGHKICYKTEYLPGCKKSMRSFCKCPGSYQLFLEKSDDFGAFEVSFNLKNQPKIRQLQVLVGDQKSKDRLLKFNVQMASEGDRTNYKLELQNPIFPIVLDSNVTRDSEGYRVFSELQAGSVEYVASGSVQPDSEKGIKLEGELYPAEKPTQKIKVSLEHKFNGWSALLLPLAKSKLQLKMHTGNQLSLEYSLQSDSPNFSWQMSSQYKTSKGDVTSMNYRVQYSGKSDSAESSSVFLYDIEVLNPKGNNLYHSLHTKLMRRAEADSKQTTASVNHKLQYGVDKKRSPIDFEARASVREVTEGELTRATGSGDLIHYWSGEPVTIKVENVKIQSGLVEDRTDGFDKQCLHAISYGIRIEENSAEYQVELLHLQWKHWSLTQQAIELKTKAKYGAKSYSAQLKHSLNGEKLQARQIAKIEYDDYVYFHLDHKLKKSEGAESIKSELLMQTAGNNKVQARGSISWPEQETTSVAIVIELNDKKVFGCEQTLRYTGTQRDHQLKHNINIEMPPSAYSIDTNVRMSRQTTVDLANFLSYQVRLITGRYRVGKSLQLLITLMNDMSFEQSTKLVGPTPAQRAILENTIDLDNWPQDAVWKHLLRVSIDSRDILNYGLTISGTRQFSTGPSWSVKDRIKFEVTAMEHSLKTEAESKVSSDSSDSYSYALKVASQDTWGLHDVKLDITNQKTAPSRWETILKLEGEIKKKSITTSVNITRGTDNSKGEHYLISTISTPESKLQVKLTMDPSPLQLAASVNLDGDFGLVPFKDLKATANFDTEKDISFESKAEIDGTQIVTARLQIAKNAFVADLKTAHPLLQEAGIKVLLDTDMPETVKCNTIIRFVGLTRRLQIKKSGTVTLSYNSPVYSLLFGLTGDVELEGFDGLIDYKKFEYDLMLKKKPGMEFQFVTSVSSPDHTSTKQPMLLLTSALNYWPFKAELKFKVNNYRGWDVKYGARAEIDYRSAFVGVEYKDQEAAATYEIQNVPGSSQVVNFRVKCTFCTDNGRDLIVGQANMTWPLRLSEFELGTELQINSLMLQKIEVRFVHRPAKKQILAAFLWDGRTQKLIDCSYTQANVEGGVRGDALLHADLRFFLGSKARAKIQASYQSGKDKEVNFDLTLANSDEEALQGKIFWLSAPRSYDNIPVTGVDRGLQLKGLGLDAYLVHTSKSDKSCEWRLSVSMPRHLRKPITAWVELADRQVKSGKVSAFDHEIVLSSSRESGVQVTLRTNSEEAKTLRVKWSGKYESQQDMRGKLEIEADGKVNILELKVQPQQWVFNYGRDTAPNSLKIEFDVSDLTSPWDMTADLTISHTTDAEKNSELMLLPGYKVPLPTTQYPFKLTVSAKSAVRLLTVSFESAGLGVKSMYYKHDFTSFPQSFNVESGLINDEETKKIWELKIKFDKDAPNAEAKCQIGDLFKLSFKEPKFQLQIEKVIDLTVQFPKFLVGSEDADKKDVTIELTLPVLKIEEPISLKASYQRLTEGRQLKIKYGRGEDDQIVVLSLNARKFRWAPKFELDLESSLISKHNLLGSWQIRSLEAGLQTSMDRNADADSYTITYKDSIRMNGEDLTTTTLRLDGENNALPTKGELTVTGKLECAIKLDLGGKNKPIKVRFSLDKLGDSRDKYSMKLTISPMKPGAWCPDFNVETECPHRQFVIGKDSKETAGETRVAVQLYLNKRQDHGVEIIYKEESTTAGIPKYTIEVALPTRKIRAICQPEFADKKFGVMTTFDWDADKSPEKIIGLDARVDFSSDVLAIVECKAPFLTKRIRLEARFENKDDGFAFQLKHLNGESEALKIKTEFSYQLQAETNVARFSLETTGALESKIGLSVQARNEIDNFRRSKVDGTLKIKIYSLEKNIKFVYRPMREITVACDHGASVSVKFTTDKMNLCQLIIFVSGNDKSAARLKLAVSRPDRKVTVKLDTGSGSFNHNSDLRGPNYRPETVLLRAEVRRDSQEVSVAAFAGKMAVGQRPSPYDAAAVPSHLSFFAFAIRSAESNKMKFNANWRTPSQEKINAVLVWLQEAFDNYKDAPVQAVRGALQHLAAVKRDASVSVNAAWIAGEISELASNDFDKLARYCERLIADNEFHLKQILGGARVVAILARQWLDDVRETFGGLMWIASELRIFEKIGEAAQQALQVAEDLIRQIPVRYIREAIVDFAEKAQDIATNWYEKAAEKVGIWFNQLWTIVSDPSGPRAASKLMKQVGEYLDSLSPLTDSAKDYIVQTWSRARSIAGASLVGMKSLVVDDLLPLAVNHLEDFKTFVDVYDNVMLELRIWYDRGATPEERQALSRTTQLLGYIFSESTLDSFTEMIDGLRLCYSGDFSRGIKKLWGKYSFTVYRPVCDSACQRGETFAAVEGYFYKPDYIPYPMWARAPAVVLRRIASKVLRKGLPESSLASAALGSILGVWNPAERLLAVRHRTAVLAGDNHIVTFDGIALTHERPCNYLVARAYPSGLFSVVQEYRKTDGRQVRDRLRVRFGEAARVTVERDGSVQVNGKTERLPLQKATEAGKSIEASRRGDVLTVRFHASLRNILVVRCSPVADSCVVSVHPLYQGGVHGLAGSNDGRASNDIHKGDSGEHVKFWTVGECAATGGASSSVAGSSDASSDCFAWFRKSDSPMARCFEAVSPAPYHAMCQGQERNGRDTCKAVRQYVERCTTENIRVRAPPKCVACRLDSEGEVAKAAELVTDKAALQRRIQVLFLVENSACAVDAIGSEGSRIRSLAGIIDRLKSANANLKTVQFGLAHFGDSRPDAPLTSVAVGGPDSEEAEEEEEDQQQQQQQQVGRFGSLEELGAALSRMRLSASDSSESASRDLLKAVAELPAHYQWQPLAQKHLIVFTCKPCTANSWNYASLFAKAQRAVKDQIFVHTVSKNAIRPGSIQPDFVGYDSEFHHLSDWSSAPVDGLGDSTAARRLATECGAELATDADSTAKGSVWRLEKFAAGGEDASQVAQLIVTKEIQRSLEKPACKRCTCGGQGDSRWKLKRQQTKSQQPLCRVARCDGN